MRLSEFLAGENHLNLEKYCAHFRNVVASRDDLTLTTYPLEYKDKKFDFLEIASKNLGNCDWVIMLRTLTHGDEVAGGLFLAAHLNQLADLAHKQNVGLVVYPCGNPSGTAEGVRYNVDGDEGSAGNNDFVRYLQPNGEWTDDLRESSEFVDWRLALDPAFCGKYHLPAETKLAYRLLEAKRDKGLINKTRVVLDCHSDLYSCETDPDGPATYQYLFEPASRYAKILDQVGQVVPVWAEKKIIAGHITDFMMTDETGSVFRHDGSWTAATYLMGIKDSLAVEVSAHTSPEDAARVYWLWVTGLIGLNS